MIWTSSRSHRRTVAPQTTRTLPSPSGSAWCRQPGTGTAQSRAPASMSARTMPPEDGIERARLRRRGAAFPAAEHFVVTGPAGPEDKDGPGFEAAWQAATAAARSASPPGRSAAGPVPRSWTGPPERQARTGGIPDAPRSAAPGTRSASQTARNAIRSARTAVRWTGPVQLARDAEAGTTAPPGQAGSGRMRATKTEDMCRRRHAGTPAPTGRAPGQSGALTAPPTYVRAAAATERRPSPPVRSRRRAVTWPGNPAARA